MMTKLIFPAVALTIAAPLAARDPVKTVQVEFARGASSKSIKGSIRGYATVNYTVKARAGQTITVKLNTSNNSNYFNVTASGADHAMFVGSMAGDRFSAALPSTGTYIVQVYLMRNAASRNEIANYTLSVAVL